MDPIERRMPAKVIEERGDLAPEMDDDEPTEEEIRSSIRRSMQQAISGETRPADEALEKIRRELASYDHARQDHRGL